MSTREMCVVCSSGRRTNWFGPRVPSTKSASSDLDELERVIEQFESSPAEQLFELELSSSESLELRDRAPVPLLLVLLLLLLLLPAAPPPLDGELEFARLSAPLVAAAVSVGRPLPANCLACSVSSQTPFTASLRLSCFGSALGVAAAAAVAASASPPAGFFASAGLKGF